MTMLKPVNGHLLIEPVKNDSFIAPTNNSYQEIGIVLDTAPDLLFALPGEDVQPVMKGQKVYFDSWLAAKYPKDSDGGFYWLVKWEDVRAVEYVEQEIPE